MSDIFAYSCICKLACLAIAFCFALLKNKMTLFKGKHVRNGQFLICEVDHIFIMLC